MRSEWITSTIDDICKLVTDGAHNSPKSVDNGYYMASVKDFTAYGFDFSNCRKISEADYLKLKKQGCVPESGDILVGKDGARYFEDVIIYRQKEQPALLSSIAILRVDDTKVTSEFLYYTLKSPAVKKDVRDNYGSGSAIPRIVLKDFKRMPISFPSLKEQKKITNICVLLDEKIQLNNRINKNLLQQAIALYEHLLQEAEWPTATILDVANKVAMGPFGSNIKISTFVPEGVPIISGNHLRGYFLEEPEFNYITEEHAERLKNSIVFPHDLIFTHAGNIGQVAMIPDGCKYDLYVLSQRQFYLRCDETKVVPEFLLLFFHSASGQHELLSYANQTGVPSIAQPASNLKKIPFKCPPMQEQLKWQEQVHPLLSRYLNNRLENERLSSLRDTLLPKLMSGELDVSNIDI